MKVLLHKGSWRLAQTAATTQLRLLVAAQRATILGASIPDGAVLIFPGAVPIRFDTPYLSLSTATNSVALSAHPDTDLAVQVTAAGRSAAGAAVRTALSGCLDGRRPPDPRCPLPDSRAVPGSLRATVSPAGVQRAAVVKLAASSAGVIAISGTIRLTGRYLELDFENQPVAKRAPVSLALTATAYATVPITIDWAGGQ